MVYTRKNSLDTKVGLGVADSAGAQTVVRTNAGLATAVSAALTLESRQGAVGVGDGRGAGEGSEEGEEERLDEVHFVVALVIAVVFVVCGTGLGRWRC